MSRPIPQTQREKSEKTVQITNRSTRRRFITAAGSVGAVSVAGCTSISGSGNPNAGGTTITAAAASGTGGLIQQLFEDYVTPETGINIDLTILSNDDLFDSLSTSLDNEQDTYDLMAMDDPWMPRLANDLAPIRDYVDDIPTDEIIDSTLEIGTWPPEEYPAPPTASGESMLRALCAVGNSHILVYNQTYFEEFGVSEPSTWNEVYDVGQKITNQIEGTHGYALRGQTGNPITAAYFSVGMSMAGDMFDDNWRFRWSNNDGVEAASFFVEDLNSISPDGVAAWNSEDVLTSLGQGRTAVAPQWPSGASVLLNEDDSPEYDNIAFTGIPEGTVQSAAQQGNWLLGINSFSPEERKDAAGDVIETFVSREAQQRYVELGGVPFRHDIFEDNMDQEPWFPALYESLQNAVPRPRTETWAEVERTIGEALNSGLVGEIDPQTAMENAGDEVESVLERNGYYE
jgi:multiple sugar transport system substrate-binding protein